MSNLIQGSETFFEVESFEGCPSLAVNMTAWTNARGKIVKAKDVNGHTYGDLEYEFNEAYRELKRHLSNISFTIVKAKQVIENIKADIILDEIPKLAEEKGLSKNANNTDFRKAVFARSERYQNSIEHLGKLEAMEKWFEGEVKLIENTCRYMRKRMDYLKDNGMVGGHYIT